MTRFLTALRCIIGFHPWPEVPVTKTFTRAVYVCPNCLDIKQVWL